MPINGQCSLALVATSAGTRSPSWRCSRARWKSVGKARRLAGTAVAGNSRALRVAGDNGLKFIWVYGPVDQGPKTGIKSVATCPAGQIVIDANVNSAANNVYRYVFGEKTLEPADPMVYLNRGGNGANATGYNEGAKAAAYVQAIAGCLSIAPSA